MKKNNKKSLFSIAFYLRWPLMFSVMLVLMNLILLALDRKAAGTLGIFTVLFVVASVILYVYSRKAIFTGLVDFAQGFDDASARMINDMDHAAAMCDESGALIWINNAFAEAFKMPDGPSGTIQVVFPDITKETFKVLDEEDAAVVHSTYEDRRYLVEMHVSEIANDDELEETRLLEEAHKRIVTVSVTDETELVNYRKKYEDSRPCEGLIYLDNYEETVESAEEVRTSLLMTFVDRRISNYVTSRSGIVRKLDKDKYFFIISDKDLSSMLEDRFSILNEIKNINTGNDVSLTLSIGVGRGGSGYKENNEFARSAIDLALGRGGDQAVVKSADSVDLFGGKTVAQGRNAHVKARVKAQAFKELLSTADRLIVMGHKNADVDSLGAAIGIWRIAAANGKKAHIVMDNVTKSLEPLYKMFAENKDYPDDMFISGEKAVRLLDENTILTVVDVNRPSYTEEPRLLENASTVVVIDHHRRGTESVEKATLLYIEPYASSACEMTAEIIQYIDEKLPITAIEAGAMYGGIVIDTQNFVNQTGIRTFEAAAFLKRNGANIHMIRKMFRDSITDSRAKAGAVEGAEIYRKCYAISELDPTGVSSPTVAGAQSANALLDMDGIKAAFVVTPHNGLLYISARSIDEVNVQVIMEKMGGGGHMSVAGAQLSGVTVEEARSTIKKIIDEMIEKGDIS